MKKVRLKVDPKSRAVVKEPVREPATPDSDIPAPEPIRLSSDVKKDVSGQAKSEAAPVAPTAQVKFDLACGQSPREGFEGVDLYAPNAKHKVDLWKFPWPWADNSVDEIHCSHFIEHIPAREIEERDLAPVIPAGEKEKVTGMSYKHPWRQRIGQDMLFAFFDECYRIIKPDCVMNVICPSVRSERAFQDPTHRRFIAQATFFYLAATWRKDNKLDHYNVRCNFSGNVNFSFPIEYQSRHDEVRNELFAHAWNVILDWTVTLKSIK